MKRPGEQTIEVIAVEDLGSADRAAIVALCTEAFAEDFAHLFDLLPGSRHLLLRAAGVLVAHACWVTRWLQPEGHPPLCTAYVEAVAVQPARQREGLGSVVMRRTAEEVAGYELTALSPANLPFYERLGWVEWRGPLAIRRAGVVVPTPDEGLMVMRTSRTPPLDLDAPITAEWREGEVW